ncbi:MAG: DUF5611 family protein [Cuniculiplasma sp.]
MREYPVKKGYKTDVEEIKERVGKFTKEVNVNGDMVTFTLPGLKKVEIQCGKKTLFVGTETDESYNQPTNSIKIFNNLLLEITGYDSKERKKRFSKI